MAAQPLADGARGQRPDQATQAPQLSDVGVGTHQFIIAVTLADHDQRQGEQTTGAGTEGNEHRPDQRRVQEQRYRQAGQQQHHATTAEQGLPRHAVGQPADGQLQRGIADHHHADHDQRHLLGEALAQAVDRQQGQHHRLEGGEQHYRPGNRRQLAAEHQ